MSRLTWGETTERYFETGLDRGVIYLQDGSVAAWNGLTSVDEGGSDSATEFFMDGRPVLYLPKPKEFKATLSAYTYPDALNELVGSVEVADGVYLDSQLGDSFGLSYRTLIGNAAENTKAGYKIHVVYNVTMAPQGASFQSLSDTVNLSEFSWEVAAVPVAIPGYRATAHVTIDTRHMDATRLSDVEAILYGDLTNDPRLPPPTELLDILSFGNTIVITDNGDGTWTAEGSYANVYQNDWATFTIENVNAISNGDGTYSISSTP